VTTAASIEYLNQMKNIFRLADSALPQLCVSDTIRKLPLVKAQTALRKQKVKYGEKRFSVWRMEFLHPAMWYVALGS